MVTAKSTILRGFQDIFRQGNHRNHKIHPSIYRKKNIIIFVFYFTKFWEKCLARKEP